LPASIIAQNQRPRYPRAAAAAIHQARSSVTSANLSSGAASSAPFHYCASILVRSRPLCRITPKPRPAAPGCARRARGGARRRSGRATPRG
jgi:hypothetical protein